MRPVHFKCDMQHFIKHPHTHILQRMNLKIGYNKGEKNCYSFTDLFFSLFSSTVAVYLACIAAGLCLSPFNKLIPVFIKRVLLP